MLGSISNQIPGVISRLGRMGNETRVSIAIQGDTHVTAILADDVLTPLMLEPGAAVWILIRDTLLTLFVSTEPPRLTLQNCIHGRVMRCCEGVVSAEVNLELDGGTALVALISFERMAALELWPDTPVWICFDARDLILVRA